ncbi:MAG: 23S rRNA (uracil(1939)-C(5))-methyltransferase RlmD [Chloroflexota bacterium]
MSPKHDKSDIYYNVQLTLESYAHGGEAIARPGGKVVFVDGGIPGEEVVARVYQSKADFARARVVEVLTPSPDRVAPPCRYFGDCGGCQFQHVTYARQLALKEGVVREQLRRLGGLPDAPVRPVLGMAEPWTYRNHARFSALRDGHLGFTRHASRALVEIEYCHLMHPAINGALARLQGHCRRMFNVSVRYGTYTGELLVAPFVPEAKDVLPTGQKEFHEALLGRTFRVSAAAFFQVNTTQAEVMMGLVREGLDLHGGETVVDAYCGVGTFGVLLADVAGRVVGIEDSVAALADASHNATGLANVELIQGATEQVLPALPGPVDGVVIDPPRAGCRPEVLEALIARRPRRIVYVSCDTATLARDLRVLVDGGFNLLSVQPIDMFPQTFHIENVAVLEQN